MKYPTTTLPAAQERRHWCAMCLGNTGSGSPCNDDEEMPDSQAWQFVGMAFQDLRGECTDCPHCTVERCTLGDRGESPEECRAFTAMVEDHTRSAQQEAAHG